MPSSSTRAIYNGNDKYTSETKPHASNNSSHSYAVSRFLADQERPPVAFMQVRDVAAAEAEETAAMRARLSAFDQQFNSSANHSSSSNIILELRKGLR